MDDLEKIEYAVTGLEASFSKDESNLPIDVLNRKPEVDRLMSLINVLSEAKSSAVFALNGEWGAGKTFLLKMLENELIPFEANGRYLVFHYNCWQYDYYDEPLIAIVSSMLDYTDSITHLIVGKTKTKVETVIEFARTTLTKLGTALIEAKLGINPMRVAEDWKNAKATVKTEEVEKYAYDELRSFTKALDYARNALKSLASEQTLIIVVDELDRCLPEYAIKILERLHHLFNGIKNIIVVLAVDQKQLAHTIEKIFGNQIDTTGYLRKFINFEVSMNYGTVTDAFADKYSDFFCQFELGQSMTKNVFNQFFISLFDGTDPRTQERIMDKVATLHRLLPENTSREAPFACFEVLTVYCKYFKIPLGNEWFNSRGVMVQRAFEHLDKLKELIRKNQKMNELRIFNDTGYYSEDSYQLQCPDCWVYRIAWYNEKVFSGRNTVLLPRGPVVDMLKKDAEDLKLLSELTDVVI